MLGAVALTAGACSRSAPSTADAALRQDLDAAQAQAAAQPASRVQFVSPLELGRAADAPARSAPRAATAGPAAASPARRAAAPVTRVARVARVPHPAPVERAPAPAPATAVDAPAPVAERATAAPSIDVEVAPLPAPSRDEPVVAAPSRRQGGERGSERHGRVWTTGDVIRNAPFPITP